MTLKLLRFSLFPTVPSLSADRHSLPYNYSSYENMGKSLHQETQGKSLLISSPPASRQKPRLPTPDTLQRVKQWGPGRAPSTAEMRHPGALIDARAADFELCGDCRAVAPRAVHAGKVFSGFFFFFWPRTTLNTRYRLQALPPYQMASWPCENTASIVPRQSPIWQRCHTTTINKSRKARNAGEQQLHWLELRSGGKSEDLPRCKMKTGKVARQSA